LGKENIQAKVVYYKLVHYIQQTLKFAVFCITDAYAQYCKVATKYAVKVPDSLSMEQAASTLWQGFTAHAFACSSYPIKAGDKILVHAAAGGVGSLIVQIAKNAGTGN